MQNIPYEEELRNNEIHRQAIVSIGMLEVMKRKLPSMIYDTSNVSIGKANENFKKEFLKIRNEVIEMVPWNIRPHVLYQVNKYFQNILY